MKTCLLEDNNQGCFTSSDELDEEDCGDGGGAVGVEEWRKKEEGERRRQ